MSLVFPLNLFELHLYAYLSCWFILVASSTLLKCEYKQELTESEHTLAYSLSLLLT